MLEKSTSGNGGSHDQRDKREWLKEKKVSAKRMAKHTLLIYLEIYVNYNVITILFVSSYFFFLILYEDKKMSGNRQASFVLIIHAPRYFC